MMKKNLFKNIVFAIGAVILSFIFLILGQTLGDFLVRPLYNSTNDGIVFSAMYFDFIGIWIVFILFCLIYKKNRFLFARLGSAAKGNNLKTILLIGLPCGIGLNLIVVFAAMLNGDISLYYVAFNPAMLLLFVIAVLIQSSAEELTCRWFLYGKLNQYFPNAPIIAIVVNAALFGALHLFNPGVTAASISNIILVGILYSLIIYYYDSFWAASVAHASWNFCQNILLGLPNSGIVTKYSLFGLDASTARDSFAYSVSFGIEGSYLSSIVLAIACVVIFITGRKNKAKEKAE